MDLNIFATNNVGTDSVRFVPTLDIPEFDLSAIDELGEQLIELEDNKIENIEKNYNSILNTKDALTGIDTGFKFGNDLIQKKKEELGIRDDDFFKLSMDQLRDPFIARQKQSQLQALLGDQEVRDVILEGQELKKLELQEKKLRRKDPTMANAFAKRILNIKNGVPNADGIVDSVYDIDANDFQRVDISKLMREKADDLGESISVVKRDTAPLGFIIFDHISKKEISMEDFIEDMVADYGDSELIRNNFVAQVDPTKPKNEQSLNDPDAINKWLRAEAKKAYGDGTFIKKSDVKKDDIALIEARRDASIAIANSRPKTTSSSKSNRTIKQRVSDAGLSADLTQPFLQLEEVGIPMNSETIGIINQSGATGGIIPQKTINALKEKYVKPSNGTTQAVPTTGSAVGDFFSTPADIITTPESSPIVEPIVEEESVPQLRRIEILQNEKQKIIDDNIFNDDLTKRLNSFDSNIKKINNEIENIKKRNKSNKKAKESKVKFVNDTINGLKLGKSNQTVKGFNTIGQGDMTISVSNTTPPSYRLKLGNDVKGVYSEEELKTILETFQIF